MTLRAATLISKQEHEDKEKEKNKEKEEAEAREVERKKAEKRKERQQEIDKRPSWIRGPHLSYIVLPLFIVQCTARCDRLRSSRTARVCSGHRTQFVRALISRLPIPRVFRPQFFGQWAKT